MKPSFLTLLLTLSLLLVGCSSTMSNSQRYAFTSNGYQVTANTVAVMIRTGVISDPDDLRTIQQINNEVKIELDAWYEALLNDTPMDAQFIQRRVEALLGRLIQYQIDAERTQGSYGPRDSNESGARFASSWNQDRGDGEYRNGGRSRLDSAGTRIDQPAEQQRTLQSQRRDQQRTESVMIADELQRQGWRYARTYAMAQH